MNKLLNKFGALTLTGTLVLSASPMSVMAMNGTESSANAAGNPTSVNNDLTNNDIHDANKTGKIDIYKYDTTSAEKDGIQFNYSTTDHDDGGTDSTLKKGDKTVTITSTGQKNAAAEEALAEYALKGVEFSYLRVGDVKTLSDVNGDEKNGDIELVYGLDTDLMSILGLKAYNAEHRGEGDYAACLEGGVNYYTSQQINTAMARVLAVNTYKDSYATNETVGGGATSSTEGERIHDTDHTDAGITAKDALEKYMKEHNGQKFADTDENGHTSKDQLPIGLYLIVETAVPENVTDTVNPWFVQLPMTDITGEQWIYDVACYPKNQTGHPTLDKKVRNAYGTPGLNYDSAGPAQYTTGSAGKVDHGNNYSATSEIVTNGDTLSGQTDEAYGQWLTAADKNNDYTYNSTCTASEGDILDYILVTKLPRITSSATYLTSYQLIDSLSKGLTYNGDLKIAIYNNKEAADKNDTSQAIQVWGTAGEKYNFTVKSQETDDGASQIETVVQATGLAEINKNYYDGNHYLVAYYTAKVNSNATAVLGDKGNPNDVTLIWKRTNDEYYNTLEDESIVYTYGLDLTKTFSDNKGNFENVKFVLYNETEDYYVVAQKAQGKDGLYYITGKTTSKETATKFVPNNSDAKGKLVINGLEADTYALTEVQTDKGYSLGKDQVKIVITPSSRTITPAEVKHMTVAEDADIEHPTADQQVVFSNQKTYTLVEEGTTDKNRMVIGELTPATASVNGKSANTEVYSAQSLKEDIVAGVTNTTLKGEIEGSTNADVILSIVNERGFKLPETGGSGLYLITILGVLAVAAGGYTMTRKKKTA